MDSFTLAIVLSAAALHAGWNALVKVGLDRFLSVTLISLAAGAISLCSLPFVAVPHPAIWPWLAVSTLLHTSYKLFLIQAYRAGDLGQVYPIARGAAPLLVSFATLFVLRDSLPPVALGGIVLLVSGVWLMSTRGGRSLSRLEGRAIAFALATSVFIASYTLTDGIGARLSQAPQVYALWLFTLDGLLMFVVLVAVRGAPAILNLAPHWRGGLSGGLMSLGAYWLVIWAMTRAPIALVAALRESSVLFAATISIVILKEPPTKWRALSAGVIVAGIILTRLT